MKRKRALVFCDHYLPSVKFGGPIRSVENLTNWLGDDIEFFIVTRDRDLGDEAPFPDVPTGVWVPVGKASVQYLSPAQIEGRRWRALVDEVDPAIVYLNSFFSPGFSLLPLLQSRLGLLSRRRLVVAPRGELHPGALRIRSRKKHAFLTLARASGLVRDVCWQATSDLERDNIAAVFGDDADIHLVPVLPAAACTVRGVGGGVGDGAPREAAVPRRKAPGELRLVFLSRVSRKKNLDGGLRLLAGCGGRITLSVFGPIEDGAYFAECRQLAAHLQPSLRFEYRGELSHAAVPGALAESDVFFLPTHGENFGHAIFEALSTGVPPLISDRTPWRGLREREAGWDLSLDNPEAFREAVGEAVAMDARTLDRWSANARAAAQLYVRESGALDANRALFDLPRAA